MRADISPKMRIEVWKKDNWHCRYCQRPVFYAPSLKLLEKLNPGHKYFHPNGEEGSMLPLFQWSWASVDHVKPVSAGGKNEIENYVTACWKCNQGYKNKEVGSGKPAPKEIIESDWDGFYGLYSVLKKKMEI
jgi:hypothetical protein